MPLIIILWVFNKGSHKPVTKQLYTKPLFGCKTGHMTLSQPMRMGLTDLIFGWKTGHMTLSQPMRKAHTLCTKCYKRSISALQQRSI